MSSLRLATVPDDHPYLDAIRPDGTHRVRFPGAGGPWAPSRLLDLTRTGAGRAALDGVDVVHVHFGYESLTAARTQQWAGAVRDSDTALVVTVHDLRNPHDADPARHDGQLAALLDAADEVVTLTPGAAGEIRRRYGRRAVVIAHPTLLDRPAGRSQRAGPRPTGPARVGVHLKSLRRNVVEPARLVRAAATGARRAGAVLRVDVHTEAAGHPALSDIRRAADAGGLELRVHDRFTDAELADYLDELDVSVLPYRFGTHSGWLELCRDLGTAVVTPDCGYYAEQWAAARTYGNNERSGLDPGSLADAVAAAVRAGAPGPADPHVRGVERAAIRAAHAEVYDRAVRRARTRSDRSVVQSGDRL